MDVPDDAFTQLSVGSWVVVHDLLATPSLNGAHGVVDEFQAEKGRYVVEFANGSRKLIHGKNLKPSQEFESKKSDPLKTGESGDLAKISGLTNATALNGRVCRVQAPKGADRYDVKLPDGTVKAIKGSNLSVLPSPGTAVTSSNLVEGAMVQRGPSWIWEDQDGGKHCLGRVLHFNTETGWATVQWSNGMRNCYRIGMNSKNDLEHADPFKHEESYLEALKKGKEAIKRCHLQRSFAYPCGVKHSHVDFFDIRDEVCEAFGGHKHGQRVQAGGMQAVMIGVALLDDDLDLFSPFYHVDGRDGASVFADQELFKKLTVIGRQKVREAKPGRVFADNRELLEIAKEVTPTFQYVMAPNSLMHGQLERYDIRDEICLRVGGFKHGQVVKEGDTKSVVIGVRLVNGVPTLFFHVDGQPGAGRFTDLEKKNFTVVGSRAVEEAPDDFFQTPAPSAELRDLATTLQCTFGYPCGTRLPHFAKFDIRDHVCEAVGGFRHGQKVRDHRGNCAVVAGVRLHDDVPTLFFHLDGSPGAGKYARYHLVRHKFNVIGSAALQEVSASDPLFRHAGKSEKNFMKKMMDEFLSAFASHAGQSTREFDPDFEYDYTFRYLQKSLDPAYFDIRDEVCEGVGGFKHGDVVYLVGMDRQAVVIGVRPDRRGTPHLWMHVEGAPGAGIFQEQDFIRRTCSVVGRQEVKEFEDPEPRAFSSEFVQGIQPTFRYPQGVKGRTKLEFFDVRDEVCLHVSGCRHGEKVKFGEVKAVAIGVKLEGIVPTMFFHVLKPVAAPGAGVFENLDLMRPHIKSLGIDTVEEVTEERFRQGWAPPKPCRASSSASSSESDSESDASSQKSESSFQDPIRHRAQVHSEEEMLGDAVLLRLSSCSAAIKQVLLNSAELAECRRDVVDANCEVTPEWANGAVLLAPLTEEKASEAQLQLRPYHVVAFKGDEGRVKAALSTLPCRQRPRIRERSDLGCSAAADVPDQEQDLEEVDSEAESVAQDL
ncbi:hecd-1, partial [Symbiodinium sp. CCMP2456]